MKTIEQLATGLNIALDMDEKVAQSALRSYIKKTNELAGRDIDPEAIKEDEADFLVGVVKAAHRAGDLGLRQLAQLEEAASEYQHAADTADALRQERDEAIRAAVGAGASKRATAAAAGVTRQYLDRVLNRA